MSQPFHFPCLFLLLLFFVHSLIAQEKAGAFAPEPQGRITGKVIEASSSKPLELANISIFQQADSALLTGSLSAKDGAFYISLPYGLYIARIHFIGLAEKRIDSLRIDSENELINLGEISLAYKTEYLDEVMISGERNRVEIALDKRIYRVGKDVSATGGSAMEALDNIPSVTVRPGAGVSLRGNRGVQILIDGKPSALVSKGRLGGLQSLSADLIAQIEVITNPAVKYEAEGTAGIINIVLKKEKKAGLNGSASLTAGHPSLFNTALSLSLKKDRVSLFGNVSFRNDIIYGIGEALQEARLEDDSTALFQSSSVYHTGGPSGTIRIGGDWYIHKSLTLTSSVLGMKAREDIFSEITYDNFLNSLDTYEGGSKRIENRLVDIENREYAATLTKTFEQNKQELVADVRFQENLNIAQSEFQETFVGSDGQPSLQEDLLQQSAFELAENRLILKLDYSLPMGEENKLEMGWQSSFRRIENAYAFEEYVQAEWLIVEDFTNTFAYDEGIHAAYGQYQNRLGDFSFQLGLRTEYTIISTSSAQHNPNRYLNFFPSTHLSYQLPQYHTIQASYTRRIKRPRSMSLNPFVALDDNRAFFSGNPDLIPEMTDTYELGHVKKWDNGSMGFFLFYRHTVNVIEAIVKETENPEGVPVFFRQPDNLRAKEDVGLEFNLVTRPTPWWNLTGDVFLYRAAIDGTNISKELVAETYTGFGRISSKFTLFKNMQLQARLNYSAPRNIAQGRRKSMTFLNLGLSRPLFKDRGKISLNVSDLFQSRNVRIDFRTNELSRENDYRWSRRTIRLTLTYRIKR